MAVALTMAAAAFVLTLVLGYPYLAFLRRAGLGKQVRREGPSSHLWKTGTPTLGGLLFVARILALAGILTLPLYRDYGRSILLPTTVMLLVAAVVLWHPEGLGVDALFVPGRREPVTIGWLMVPLACVAIMATAHAVNLTDGLDGLAGHTAAVAYTAYGTIAFLQGQAYLVTFCFTVAGALLAFLWFNAHPAEVFMGDTGALAPGATLAIVALILGQVLLLPIIGFVFVAVTLSVILQVAYFKLSGGKRLFRMAPLHIHFELMGWSQMQVAQRFWLISMVTGLLGVAMALV